MTLKRKCIRTRVSSSGNFMERRISDNIRCLGKTLYKRRTIGKKKKKELTVRRVKDLISRQRKNLNLTKEKSDKDTYKKR